MFDTWKLPYEPTVPLRELNQSPQHLTLPSVIRAQLFCNPGAICLTPASPGTVVGPSSSVPRLLPSWP
jgi:hypothetical protein